MILFCEKMSQFSFSKPVYSRVNTSLQSAFAVFRLGQSYNTAKSALQGQALWMEQKNLHRRAFCLSLSSYATAVKTIEDRILDKVAVVFCRFNLARLGWYRAYSPERIRQTQALWTQKRNSPMTTYYDFPLGIANRRRSTHDTHSLRCFVIISTLRGSVARPNHIPSCRKTSFTD